MDARESTFSVARDVRSFAWEFMMSKDDASESEVFADLITSAEVTEMIEDLHYALGVESHPEATDELQKAIFALEVLRGDHDDLNDE